ncbi:RDD family protein [Photobacterium japonica]|uniref:RDD family protein n=1 Tax=Photobacterium japonica TaxID=2910235 RepID=UPI003D0C75EE
MRIEPQLTDIKVAEEGAEPSMSSCTQTDIAESEHGIGAYLNQNATAPQNTSASSPRRYLASPGRRYVGQMLDAIVAFVIIFALFAAGKALALEQNYIDIMALGSGALYWIFADALPRGQSLGKRVLSMAVIDKDTGAYCSLWQSFLRNILTPVIGVIDAIFILTRKRQRLGDLAANTIVIKH